MNSKSKAFLIMLILNLGLASCTSNNSKSVLNSADSNIEKTITVSNSPKTLKIKSLDFLNKTIRVESQIDDEESAKIVTINGDSNLINNIQISLEENEIIVEANDNYIYNIENSSIILKNIDICTVVIDNSDVFINNISPVDFNLSLDNNSYCRMYNINPANASFNIDNSSYVEINSTKISGDLKVNCNNNSRLTIYNSLSNRAFFTLNNNSKFETEICNYEFLDLKNGNSIFNQGGNVNSSIANIIISNKGLASFMCENEVKIDMNNSGKCQCFLKKSTKLTKNITNKASLILIYLD